MNKSVKANIVTQAISAKFKGEYEKAFRDVVVAARKFAITNSKHNEFMALKLPTDMLLHINRESGLRLVRTSILILILSVEPLACISMTKYMVTTVRVISTLRIYRS